MLQNILYLCCISIIPTKFVLTNLSKTQSVTYFYHINHKIVKYLLNLLNLQISLLIFLKNLYVSIFYILFFSNKMIVFKIDVILILRFLFHFVSLP